MFDFFYNVDFTEGFNPDVIIPVLNSIVSDYGLEIDYLNIVFVSDEELLEINRKFLNHDYYTDILTFNYAVPGDKLEAELYISIDRVRDNALSVACSFEMELSRVIIHGLLHLSGFDDASPEERSKMTGLENKYLALIPFHVKPGN
jgi:probable rRNA maturation factor